MGFVVAVASICAITFAGSAQANSQRVTRGDAQAVFEAAGNGGWAVLLNGGVVEEAAPADFLPDAQTRINPAVQWNGRHFCELDWHLIQVLANEGNPIGGSRTIKDILEVLDTVAVIIKLDGNEIETMRSANKRTTNPGRIGAEEAFFVSIGRILAPDELSVGSHTVQFIGLGRGRPPQVMPLITIHIDPAGAGTCL